LFLQQRPGFQLARLTGTTMFHETTWPQAAIWITFIVAIAVVALAALGRDHAKTKTPQGNKDNGD
jgi:hypothetical protein